MQRIHTLSLVSAWIIIMIIMKSGAEAAAFVHIREPVEIPMRDVREEPYGRTYLCADAFFPAESGEWPVIFIQTPYSKDLLAPLFTTEITDDPIYKSPDYAYAVMDIRGFFTNVEDYYVGCPTWGEDGYDAVEWLSAQEWCTGKIGTWGVSALGKVQFKTAAEAPPHLTCCAPLGSHYRERYELYYPGGVYARNRNEFIGDYYGSTGMVRDHPYYDATWHFTETYSANPEEIKVPMLHITGWYDHQTGVSMKEMEEVDSLGGPGAAGKQKIVIGPWAHSSIGKLEQGQMEYPEAEYASSIEVLSFFDHYLRDIDNGYEQSPRIKYYRLGDDVWKSSEAWPPQGVIEKHYYLYADGTLSTALPFSTSGSLEYTADPENPVPTLWGAILTTEYGQQGPGDLRPIEERNDVLTFTTPVREQPLNIAGSITANFYVKCSTIDADIAVRVTQVYPDGRSMLLVDGIRRISLRNGFEDAEFPGPDQIYFVPVELPPLAVSIPTGHALRISAAPSNYDRFDVNMQDGSSLSDEPDAHAMPGTLELFMNADYPSSIILPELQESVPLGVRIDMPEMIHPGENFYVTGYLDNPGNQLEQVPVFFLLDIFGEFWFWDSWAYYSPPDSEEVDYRIMTVPPGTTQLSVVSPFPWPDTGNDSMQSLFFCGAMLNENMTSLLGKAAIVEWGYGP